MNTVEFSVSERKGKMALWVTLDNDRRNIWDLDEKEATKDVLSAIRSAFEIGMMFQRNVIYKNSIKIPGPFSNWKEE